MFNGESKKRPTVSLRGKSKEEDRTEFIRRARVSQQQQVVTSSPGQGNVVNSKLGRAFDCPNVPRQSHVVGWLCSLVTLLPMGCPLKAKNPQVSLLNSLACVVAPRCVLLSQSLGVPWGLRATLVIKARVLASIGCPVDFPALIPVSVAHKCFAGRGKCISTRYRLISKHAV